MVMLLIGLLSAVAMASLSRLGGAQSDIAAARVRSVLVYAQEQAMASVEDTWVVVNTSRDVVTAFREASEGSGRSGRVRITDPLSRKPLELSLADTGAGLVAVDFGGTDEVMFTRDGSPADADGLALGTDGTITLTDGRVVRVTRNTGLVTVD